MVRIILLVGWVILLVVWDIMWVVLVVLWVVWVMMWAVWMIMSSGLCKSLGRFGNVGCVWVTFVGGFGCSDGSLGNDLFVLAILLVVWVVLWVVWYC